MTNDSDTGASYTLTLKGKGVAVATDIDAAMLGKVMGLVFAGASPDATSPEQPKPPKKRRATRKRATSVGGEDGKPKKRRRAGAGPGIVRDLSLRPAGKQSFKDFAQEKKPKTHQQKQAVILYWLKHEAGMESGITVDHVNTCYVEADWQRPAQLPNALSVTAVKKGWLDSGDFDDVKITTRGEDMVKHDLPSDSKKS